MPASISFAVLQIAVFPLGMLLVLSRAARSPQSLLPELLSATAGSVSLLPGKKESMFLMFYAPSKAASHFRYR